MRRLASIVIGILALAVSDGAADDKHGTVTTVSPSRDLSVPSSWAGEWRITTTYRRGDAGSVWAVDDVTDVIRAGEPLGLSALTRGGLAACTGSIRDRRLEASCSRQFIDALCHVETAVHVVLERDGEMLAGSGEATGTTTGDCGALPPGTTRATFELVGTRLGRDPGDPGRALVPLPTRFIVSVPLLTLVAVTPQVKPVIEDDCKDDGWQGFTTPAFKNQGQCIKFVHEQEKPR